MTIWEPVGAGCPACPKPDTLLPEASKNSAETSLCERPRARTAESTAAVSPALTASERVTADMAARVDWRLRFWAWTWTHC